MYQTEATAHVKALGQEKCDRAKGLKEGCGGQRAAGKGVQKRETGLETGGCQVTLVLQAGNNFWLYPKDMRTIEKS